MGDTTKPAFPVYHGEMNYPEPGMSLREWFAGMALQGLVSRDAPLNTKYVNEHGTKESACAAQAIALSDAMIERLNQ